MSKLLVPGSTVHCLFEQTGTFRDAARSLGYAAYCYDIEDSFGETDYQVDLFKEIKDGFHKRGSVFDSFRPEDLIFAFFPCTYFSNFNRLMLRFDDAQKQGLSNEKKVSSIIARSKKVQLYFERLNQLLAICLRHEWKMIIENPCTGSLIRSTFYREPDLIDSNRVLLGDKFRKPTMYWFVNCQPARGLNNMGYNAAPADSTIMNGARGFARSIITPEYAKNFIRLTCLGEDVYNPLQLDFTYE